MGTFKGLCKELPNFANQLGTLGGEVWRVHLQVALFWGNTTAHFFFYSPLAKGAIWIWRLGQQTFMKVPNFMHYS